MLKLLLALAMSATAIGFNFRASSGFVTDGTDETYVVAASSYPTTRAGWTFGWSSGPEQAEDNSSGIDRRLAGNHQKGNSGTQNVFRVDLPSAGDYEIRLALGNNAFQQNYMYCQVRDNASAVITVDDTDGAVAARWDDASGVERTLATWPGSNVAVTATFTGTILNLVIGSPSAQANATAISHLQIAEVPATAALTGTATASIDETDIVAGGKTIILTLTGDTWIPA